MDKDEVKGGANKAKGSVKEAAGKATGNDKLKTEGQVDKAKGEAQKTAGKVKESVKKH